MIIFIIICIAVFWIAVKVELKRDEILKGTNTELAEKYKEKKEKRLKFAYIFGSVFLLAIIITLCTDLTYIETVTINLFGEHTFERTQFTSAGWLCFFLYPLGFLGMVYKLITFNNARKSYEKYSSMSDAEFLNLQQQTLADIEREKKINDGIKTAKTAMKVIDVLDKL